MAAKKPCNYNSNQAAKSRYWILFDEFISVWSVAGLFVGVLKVSGYFICLKTLV